MIMVTVVAELLQEYSALVARALRRMLRDDDGPFPRRLRFAVLRNLPLASFPPGSGTLRRPLPPPPAATIAL
ncbi:hypothetical protein Taro_012698 [Colocasia esculenta]|uniref:Uncharacterized protein n=1 Tax=Colocasia esculenta TaxID=4460 RepID=A0A843U9H0_COLES|nr:hypothetical protein [Colocasia esculenta]